MAWRRLKFPPRNESSVAPTAKDALRSANRFGLGEPGTEHMLIVLLARGEGGACEILRALEADPNRIRFETKKRAWLSNVAPRPGAQLRGTIRASLDEPDFGD